MHFMKYHALGNDYLVMTPDAQLPLSADQITRICHRNYGVGSDGILYGPLPSDSCDFALKIFNPDGSTAEKSGNGLRIFARFLWDKGLADVRRFSVETLGGNVACQVLDEGRTVTVEMGRVSFDSEKIPVEGPPREVLQEEIEIANRRLRYSAATVGNPHCVVMSEEPSESEARTLGPLLETDSRFPNRTNVQFAKVINRRTVQIEIWERGAGYTLASGSSSTAVAAVVHRLGLCDAEVTVTMPGGELHIELTPSFEATLTGSVTKVCEGELADEIFSTEK